ncbi:MAG: bifunctional adenosylcobinamide kinase/adenosylcobinamide-phosphate guanylyltransferase [Candidatus Omnitrophica bacterium]|nr:bifunctional adenosylcobinamide kinase/adenosylcobinamide-phosphate guanylyltransferase [Candidatus Omnitrophota bacterium]
MGKITFILGGARSGKSSQAIKLVQGLSQKVAFVATCIARDVEMEERIENHKKNRPQHWQTFEVENKLSEFLKKITFKFDVLVVDCLTLFISNLLCKGVEADTVESEISKVLKSLKSANYKTIIVSNEVGLGIVPENKLGRDFRDLAGRINQLVAAGADEVLFMVSGLALQMKGGKDGKDKKNN